MWSNGIVTFKLMYVCKDMHELMITGGISVSSTPAMQVMWCKIYSITQSVIYVICMLGTVNAILSILALLSYCNKASYNSMSSYHYNRTDIVCVSQANPEHSFSHARSCVYIVFISSAGLAMQTTKWLIYQLLSWCNLGCYTVI